MQTYWKQGLLKYILLFLLDIVEIFLLILQWILTEKEIVYTEICSVQGVVDLTMILNYKLLLSNKLEK